MTQYSVSGSGGVVKRALGRSVVAVLGAVMLALNVRMIRNYD